MKIFHSKPEDPIEKLLKQSAQASNLDLDSEDGKARLMRTIQNQTQVENTWSSNPFILRSSLALAVMILFVGGTFAAAQESLPGDILFSVHKLREKVMLSLPLNPVSHAEIQASIVEDRLKALDVMPVVETTPFLQVRERQLETLKEAETSLTQAIDTIQKTRDSLLENGREEQAAKLNQVLLNIAEIAEQREERIREFEEHIGNVSPVEVRDSVLQEKVVEKFSEFKKARDKARLQRENRD